MKCSICDKELQRDKFEQHTKCVDKNITMKIQREKSRKRQENIDCVKNCLSEIIIEIK